MTVREPTKKARRERAQALIDRNVIGVEFSRADVSEMNALCGVTRDGFVRRRNPRYPSDPRHLYASSSGTWNSFSWVKAISPLPPEQRAKKVMRASIAQDMADFLDSQDDQSCVVCGAVDPTVDHTPPFDEIVLAFVEIHGWPAMVDAPDGVGDMFENIDLEAEWIAFHQSRIEYLQILCRPCNASKGKRGPRPGWQESRQQGIARANGS